MEENQSWGVEKVREAGGNNQQEKNKNKTTTVKIWEVLSGSPDISVLGGLDLMFIWPFLGLRHIMHSEGRCRLLAPQCSSGLGLPAKGWHQFGPVCSTGTAALLCLVTDSTTAESRAWLPSPWYRLPPAVQTTGKDENSSYAQAVTVECWYQSMKTDIRNILITLSTEIILCMGYEIGVQITSWDLLRSYWAKRNSERRNTGKGGTQTSDRTWLSTDDGHGPEPSLSALKTESEDIRIPWRSGVNSKEDSRDMKTLSLEMQVSRVILCRTANGNCFWEPGRENRLSWNKQAGGSWACCW